MKKKGFTLIELMAVITIIGALMLLVSTAVINQIRSKKDELDSASLKLLYSTTEQYIEKNYRSYLKIEGQIYKIPALFLVDADLINVEFLKQTFGDYNYERIYIEVEVVDDEFKYEAKEYYVSADLDSKFYYLLRDSGNSKYDYMGTTYIINSANSSMKNYIEFSGYKWRMIGQNEDGSIKAIYADDVISVNYNGNAEPSQNSIFKYLNSTFYMDITYPNYIVDSKWCYASATNSNSTTSGCASSNANIYNSKIGLIDLFEYNASVEAGNSYIYGKDTVTMTSNGNQLYNIGSDGTISSVSSEANVKIRPIINLSEYAHISSGNGSFSTPYIIE